MGRTKEKFQHIWASATDIGRQFGLSAIAVNKRLAAAGLRDDSTKQPTRKALDEDWALATPMRNGTPHFMWSRQKVRSLFAAETPPLSHEEVVLESFLRDVFKLEREAEETGIDKVLYFFSGEELPRVRRTNQTNETVRRVCARLGVQAREAEIESLVLGAE